MPNAFNICAPTKAARLKITMTTSVALVAHNPGLTHLVNKLGANPITQNLVTFGTALFATTQSWPELTFGSAELISLQSPKTIFGN